MAKPDNPFEEFYNADQPLDQTIDESGIATKTPIPSSTNRIIKNTLSTSFSQYASLELPSGDTPVQVGSGIIVGILGAGGMAKVYKIWNEKLEVYRAVKLLIPRMGKDLQNRFETEAKITAKLHHPNIVEIYSIGDWQGIPYIEMELISGCSLETMISKYGKLPNVVANAIAIQIAQALCYAHNQEFLLYGKVYKGIIHRDLKPANIMISENGTIKLMDFGIARPTEMSLHTMDGHIVGTLQYLSPEQLDGVQIDCRSDIYSFGTILYEMLTGTKTFPQETLTNLMKMKAINSYRQFSEYDFKTNRSMVSITERCLRKEPVDRYADAQELLEKLEGSYRSFTQDTNEYVVKQYYQNPLEYLEFSLQGIGGAVGRTMKRFALLWGIGAAVLLIAAVSVYILYFMKGRDETGPSPSPGTATQRQTPAPATPSSITAAVPSPTPVAPDTHLSVPQEYRSTTGKQYATQRKSARALKVGTPEPMPAAGSTAPVVNRLKQKYGTDDLLTLGQRSIEDQNYYDAIEVLKIVPRHHPEINKVLLYLFWAFVESKNYSAAGNIRNKIQSNDSFFEMLTGRMEEGSGNYHKAIEHYQSCLTKGSALRPNAMLRNDALYQIAVVYDKIYRDAMTPENKFKAANAWNTLKRVYQDNPAHPRFILANKKLAE